MLLASWELPKHVKLYLTCPGERGSKLMKYQPALSLATKAWGSRISLGLLPHAVTHPSSAGVLLLFTKSHEVLGNLWKAMEKQPLLGSRGENPWTSWSFWSLFSLQKAAFLIVTPQALMQISPSRKSQALKARNANVVCCTGAPIAGHEGAKAPEVFTALAREPALTLLHSQTRRQASKWEIQSLKP